MKRYYFSLVYLLGCALYGYGDLLITETEHFEYIYDTESKNAVAELVSYGDEVYREVTSFIDNYPKKITVVIDGETDAISDHFYPLRPHIKLSLAPITLLDFGAGYGSRLKMVFIHELTHFVQLVDRRGIFGSLSYVFGRSLATVPGGLTPGWFVEGTAVLTETLYTEGGRGRSAFFQMAMQSALAGEMFSVKQAAYSSAYPPWARYYLAGYYITEYLDSTYGRGTLNSIYQEFAQQPYLGFPNAVKRVTGASLNSIYQNLIDTLSKTLLRPEPSLSTSPLSQDSDADYTSPIVTDLGIITYKRSASAYPALVLINPETGNEQVLSEVVLSDEAGFTATADAQTLIVSVIEPKMLRSGPSLVANLYRIDPNTGKGEQITRDGGFYRPSISRDGSNLVALKKRDGYADLMAVDMISGSSKVILSIPGASIHSPSFSSDGSALVFTVETPGERLVWRGDFTTDPGKGASLTGVRPVSGFDGSGSFFPMEENGLILYSTDISGKLEIVGTREDGSSSVLVHHPLAAYSAGGSGNPVVYGAFEADRYVVRQADQQIQEKQLDTKVGSFSPPEVILPDVPTRRYIDLALPSLWLPLPIYYDPFNIDAVSIPTLRAAPGIFAMGNDYRLTTMWTTYFTLRTDVLQPGAEFVYSQQAGPFSLRYNLYQGYGEIDFNTYVQVTQQNAGVELPLVYASRFGISRYLSIGASLGYEFLVQSTDPFSFMNGFSLQSVTQSHTLSVTPSLAFSVAKRGGRRDFYSPALVSLSGYSTIPLVSDSSAAVSGNVSIVAGIPSLIDHHVVRLSTRSGYSEAGDTRIPGAAPKWGYVSGSLPYNGRTTMTLEYLMALALLDQPLTLGLNVQDIGGGLHAEMAVGWDHDSIDLLDELYVGGHVTAMIGTTMHVPFTVGITARIDLDGSDQFVFLRDVRGILGLDLGSIIGAGNRDDMVGIHADSLQKNRR